MASTWLSTRTTLLRRLQNREETGWEEFVDSYGRVIHAVAARSGLPPEDCEDVTQDTLVAVARRIGGFTVDEERGSFKSWLLTIARSRIVDCFRKRQREHRFTPPPADATTQTTFLERLPDDQLPHLEAIYEEEWRQGLYLAARERIRKQASPDQYQIFDLYVVREWPVEKVSRTLGITPNQVYIAKHRIGEAIAHEVAKLAAFRLEVQ